MWCVRHTQRSEQSSTRGAKSYHFAHVFRASQYARDSAYIWHGYRYLTSLADRSGEEVALLGWQCRACSSRDVIELDELWSFMLKKENKRWVWLAICRRTRQIIAYSIGSRSDASCRELWNRLPSSYRRCLSYSDFWASYAKVFDIERHQSVGKESGQTAHIERWNSILRQRLARFVRKTLSFSKVDTLHDLVLRLFIHRYNSHDAPPLAAA